MKHKNNIWEKLCFVATLFLPFLGAPVGAVAAYPGINAESTTDITSLSPQGQEILWEHEIILAAAQTSPFSDNMTGKVGSGKPIIIRNDTTKVAGQQIVIPTLDVMGSRGVPQNGIRVGNEEKLKPGNFLLTIGLYWFGVGIDNAAMAQTVLGKDWKNLSKQLLAKRLQKKQTDDNLVTLVASATVGYNAIFPNNKTLDTLSSSDVFGTSLLVQSNGTLKDIGAMPMDVRKSNQTMGKDAKPEIPRFLQFLTDVGARPIKTETAYLEGVRQGKERGDTNNLFTGDYSDWDGQIIYPWINIRHGAYGSIGSILQPEALLGNAVTASVAGGGAGNTIPGGLASATAGGLTGGGSSTAAAVDRDYFEFFSLMPYIPIGSITQTVGTAPRYFLIIDKVSGKVSFFSYTGNTGPLLTGLTRLGSVTTGDYNTTIGSVTWNSGAFLIAADGMGYQGVTEGAIASGSLILEANAKGVPIFRGIGMGEMALVAGYGKLPNGKAMASPTNYSAPHDQAFADGIEISYGMSAFKRPDNNTPNYVVYTGARQQQGLPVVS